MLEAASDDLIYTLTPNAQIRIRGWDENAVLYHGASASTSEISTIMATSLELLGSAPLSLAELTDLICKSDPHLDKAECLEHLTLGYRELGSQGIVQKLSA